MEKQLKKFGTASNLGKSIGKPPRKLSVIAIGSFTGVVMLFYFLFFVFHFNYHYDGVLMQNKKGKNGISIYILNSSDLNHIRLKKWLIKVKTEKDNKIITYPIDSDIAWISNNTFDIKGGNQWSEDINIYKKVPCKIQFSSLTLAKLFFK